MREAHSYWTICRATLFGILIVMATQIELVENFDAGNFKTCHQSAFCKRQREYKPETSPYVADFDSMREEGGHVLLDLTNLDNGHPFNVEVIPIKDGIVRLKINEANPMLPRYEVPDTIQELKLQSFVVTTSKQNETITLRLTEQPHIRTVVTCHPFRVDVYDAEEPILSLNSRHLLNIEHLREKPGAESEPDSENAEDGNEEEESPEEQAILREQEEEEQKKAEEENKKKAADENNLPGMWEETFKSHRDSKPRGPESIGLDTAFLNFAHVYGIPEHADSLALKSTAGGEPYRLYNLDVFEYELDSRAALYGSIPFMIGHNAKRTVGLLWLNSAETWVDVETSDDSRSVLGTLFGYFGAQEAIPEVNVHWMSESGVIDVMVMAGPSPRDVMRQYTTLTGTSYMPPMWATAYHQSRWNYKDERDVEQVDTNFDKHDIPYDCLWLDIEHTDGKRYFTWDNAKFPNPVEMQNKIAAKGRKMVTIIDPHIKVDTGYHIYSEAQKKGYFIQNKDGGEFRGWCWPGDSAYLDFTLPEVREWWASQFSPDIYQGSTLNLFTWNDMNEPSVFNGPEITMHKDIKHGKGWEHRHVHNMYGILQQMSTFSGQLKRTEGKERPFILSRAFFVGTQKYGAIWTGDNTAEWGHLAYSTPMLLTIGLCGITHCGADVGGFFKNPEPELLTRWYQAAAYQPFFRAHAHIDTSRREPWLYDDKFKIPIRTAIRERYELLPYWYTLFYQSHKTGEPAMRALWYEFPADTSLFARDDTFMVGKSLLVYPITRTGATAAQVYLPGHTGWYDVHTHQFYPSPNNVAVSAPLDRGVVFQRGGTIVPRKLRVRRCSQLMIQDPYTLFVALDPKGTAEGEVYMDDGHSYNYLAGNYNYKKLKFENRLLTSKSIDAGTSWDTDAWLERVVILGITPPQHVTITTPDGHETALGFAFESSTRTLTIRKPGVNMASDWSIRLR